VNSISIAVRALSGLLILMLCCVVIPIFLGSASPQSSFFSDVSGSPYFDTISIKAEDDRSIVETRKKGGKVVATSRQQFRLTGRRQRLGDWP
jgi:hypothetical protein